MAVLACVRQYGDSADRRLTAVAHAHHDRFAQRRSGDAVLVRAREDGDREGTVCGKDVDPRNRRIEGDPCRRRGNLQSRRTGEGARDRCVGARLSFGDSDEARRENCCRVARDGDAQVLIERFVDADRREGRAVDKNARTGPDGQVQALPQLGIGFRPIAGRLLEKALPFAANAVDLGDILVGRRGRTFLHKQHEGEVETPLGHGLIRFARTFGGDDIPDRDTPAKPAELHAALRASTGVCVACSLRLLDEKARCDLLGRSQAHDVLIEFSEAQDRRAGDETRTGAGTLVEDVVAFHDRGLGVEEETPVRPVPSEKRVRELVGDGVEKLRVDAPAVAGLLSHDGQRVVLANDRDPLFRVSRVGRERAHVEEAGKTLGRAELGAQVERFRADEHVSNAQDVVAHIEFVGERAQAGREAEVIEQENEIVDVCVVRVETPRRRHLVEIGKQHEQLGGAAGADRKRLAQIDRVRFGRAAAGEDPGNGLVEADAEVVECDRTVVAQFDLKGLAARAAELRDAVPGDDQAIDEHVGSHLGGNRGGIEVNIQRRDTRRAGDGPRKRSRTRIVVAGAKCQVAVRIDEDFVVRDAEVGECEGQSDALAVIVCQGQRDAVRPSGLIERRRTRLAQIRVAARSEVHRGALQVQEVGLRQHAAGGVDDRDLAAVGVPVRRTLQIQGGDGPLPRLVMQEPRSQHAAAIGAAPGRAFSFGSEQT